jgi:hypothetical protein
MFNGEMSPRFSRFVRTVFPASQEALDLEREVRAQTGSLPAHKPQKTVGETVGQILQAIKENTRITREGLSKKTGLTIRGVE